MIEIDREKINSLAKTVLENYNFVNDHVTRIKVLETIDDYLNENKLCNDIDVICDERNNPCDVIEARTIRVSLVPITYFGRRVLEESNKEQI